MSITLGQYGIKSGVPFYENSQNVTVDFATTTGRNTMAVGPITVNDGVTLTVTSDTILTII